MVVKYKRIAMPDCIVVESNYEGSNVSKGCNSGGQLTALALDGTTVENRGARNL
jgi:hypothetical protein